MTPTDRRTALTLHSVDLGYSNGPLVHQASLDIHPGEVVALLGERDKEPTLVLRSLVGLATIYGGDIALLGTPIEQMRAWDTVGYVPPRADCLPPHATSVGDFIATGVLPTLRPTADPRQAVLAAMRLTRVERHADADVRTLPPGTLRRVLLARACVTRPALLLVDNLFATLSPDDENAVDDALCQVIAAGTTVLMAVDHPDAAHGHARRTIAFQGGRIVYDGPTGQVTATGSFPTTPLLGPPSGRQRRLRPDAALTTAAGLRPGGAPARSAAAYGYGMGTMQRQDVAPASGPQRRVGRHERPLDGLLDGSGLTAGMNHPTSGIVPLGQQALRGLRADMTASGPIPQATPYPPRRRSTTPRNPGAPTGGAPSGPLGPPNVGPSGPPPGRGTFGDTGPTWGQARHDGGRRWSWEHPPPLSGSALDDIYASYADRLDPLSGPVPAQLSGRPEDRGLGGRRRDERDDDPKQASAWAAPSEPRATVPPRRALRVDTGSLETTQAMSRSEAQREATRDGGAMSRAAQRASAPADDHEDDGYNEHGIPTERLDLSERELPGNVTFFHAPPAADAIPARPQTPQRERRAPAEQRERRASEPAERRADDRRADDRRGRPTRTPAPRTMGAPQRPGYDAAPPLGPNPYLHGGDAAGDPLSLPPSLSGPMPVVPDQGDAEFVDLRPEHTTRPPLPRPSLEYTSMTGPMSAAMLGGAPMPRIGADQLDDDRPALPPMRRRTQQERDGKGRRFRP